MRCQWQCHILTGSGRHVLIYRAALENVVLSQGDPERFFCVQPWPSAHFEVRTHYRPGGEAMFGNVWYRSHGTEGPGAHLRFFMLGQCCSRRPTRDAMAVLRGDAEDPGYSSFHR